MPKLQFEVGVYSFTFCFLGFRVQGLGFGAWGSGIEGQESKGSGANEGLASRF